jgi:hypothetical protein
MAVPARCCLQALQDATLRWPFRNKSRDGIIGDAAHQKRHSDHNDGNAFDLTNDTAHGVDCGVLSKLVISDARVTYVIWNRQIYNRARASEGWRPYSGDDPHDHHMHVSINATSREKQSPWPWSAAGSLGPIPPLAPVAYNGHPLRLGSRGTEVVVLQIQLRSAGFSLTPDGSFGPKTFHAVQGFQQKKQLKIDGTVGPKTWAALWN